MNVLAEGVKNLLPVCDWQIHFPIFNPANPYLFLNVGLRFSLQKPQFSAWLAGSNKKESEDELKKNTVKLFKTISHFSRYRFLLKLVLGIAD